jgi:hypothetical protein
MRALVQALPVALQMAQAVVKQQRLRALSQPQRLHEQQQR